MSKSVDVVMIRHAQSTWNEQERFSGWGDPALTAKGIVDAMTAAANIRALGYRFDHVYASRLQRAEHTARIILQGIHDFNVKVQQDWRLNERHFGDLQGKFRASVISKVGEEQVRRWRWGYQDIATPMSLDNPSHPAKDRRYSNVPPEAIPSVESLQDVQNRVLLFWNEIVVAHIKAGKKVLICSHGNTLRALMMSLSGMSAEEVETFEIPTGAPIIYRFEPDATPISWEYAKIAVAA